MRRVSAGAFSLHDEIRVVNPATLAEVGSVPTTPPEALGEVIAEARLAHESWRRHDLTARARLLRTLARAVLDDMDEIAATIVAETGKPRLEAVSTEVFVALDTATWLARNVERLLRPESLRLQQPYLWHKRASLRFEPVGVVGVISPWNFPFSIPFTQAAAAVAAGNAVVIKPSELTPLSGAWVEDLFRRAGAPPGLVRIVQGAGETLGDALARHRGLGRLLFTGSGEVGRLVAARAAEHLCPATLELGGKDPMLVLADADLERAIEGALWGSFSNCGQICAGIERIYIEEALFEPFVTGLADRAGRLQIGAGDDPDVDLGPLISEEQRARTEELVADAIDGGAELVAGGDRPPVHLPGWFHEPTVLVGEPDGARIAREEIFGPVVTVVKIENAEDGIRRANASPFGLGASVWTRDRARARSVAARLEAGSVWTNDVAYSYGAAQAPWGGCRESAYGRTHGRDGLRSLTYTKYVDEDRGRLTPPWWFPYDEHSADGFNGVLGTLYGSRAGARVAAAWTHRRGILELGRRAVRRP
jgi:succinate-semialdehyde dehydrogenase/glutarate-semialdehyde dehydrogenase